MKRGVIVILAAMAVGCSPAPGISAANDQRFITAIPICTLLAKPDPFVGKRVEVSGYYYSTPHGPIFRDDSCERGEMPLARDHYEADDRRARAIIKAAWRSNKRAIIPVVISGTLKDHFVGDTVGLMCTGAGNCERFGLYADAIVAARPPKRRWRPMSASHPLRELDGRAL